MEKNYFVELFAVNVNEYVEKKNGLSYVSWPFAWAEIKKRYPKANYTIYENQNGWNYFTDGRTCWVKTGVTIEGQEHIEYLPVLDHRNKSISVENVTSFDVNKAIQRSLTKAIARHGLGLYIYAGEDLPEDEKGTTEAGFTGIKKPVCADCGKIVHDEYIAEGTMKAYGRVLCKECGMKLKRAKNESKADKAE